MATGRDWHRGTSWYEHLDGYSASDEIVGFVENEQMDDEGYFSRYPTQPTYDGLPIDPALLYGEGWEQYHQEMGVPVTRPEQ